MTERARIREIYKKKKRLPAPEIAKPKKKKGKYHYKIEQRLTEDAYKRHLETFKRNKWCFAGGSKGPDMNWHGSGGNYCNLKDVENALKALEKYKNNSNSSFHNFISDYDYRIVEV